MQEDIKYANTIGHDHSGRCYHHKHHKQLSRLLHSHGIPERDINWILKLCVEENLSEKLTLTRVASFFEVLLEWLEYESKNDSFTKDLHQNDSNIHNDDSNIAKNGVPVFEHHSYPTLASWAEKLISYKVQGLQPRVVFVGTDKFADKFADRFTDKFSAKTVTIFVELTKKIKTNMACRVYQHSEPPCWQEALRLVEKAGLPYWGIMLESGPYLALSQRTVQPQEAFRKGSHWPLLELAKEFGASNDLHNVDAVSLSFYANKLRYTIPEVTQEITNFQCPLI